jgi:hypothetical protein
MKNDDIVSLCSQKVQLENKIEELIQNAVSYISQSRGLSTDEAREWFMKYRYYSKVIRDHERR